MLLLICNFEYITHRPGHHVANTNTSHSNNRNIMSRLALGVLVAALVAMISAHPIQVSDDAPEPLAEASVSEAAFSPDSSHIQQDRKRGSVFSGHGLVFGPTGGGSDDLASSSSITGDYGLVVSPGKVQKGGGLVGSQTVEVGGVPYTISGGDLTVSR